LLPWDLCHRLDGRFVAANGGGRRSGSMCVCARMRVLVHARVCVCG